MARRPSEEGRVCRPGQTPPGDQAAGVLEGTGAPPHSAPATVRSPRLYRYLWTTPTISTRGPSDRGEDAQIRIPNWDFYTQLGMRILGRDLGLDGRRWMGDGGASVGVGGGGAVGEAGEDLVVEVAVGGYGVGAVGA